MYQLILLRNVYPKRGFPVFDILCVCDCVRGRHVGMFILCFLIVGQVLYTLGPVHKEFGCNEHPAITSRFLCIKIMDCNVKKFGCNEHPAKTSRFLCIKIIDCTVKKFGCNEHPHIEQFLLHLFRSTPCKRDPVYVFDKTCNFQFLLFGGTRNKINPCRLSRMSSRAKSLQRTGCRHSSKPWQSLT